MKTCPIGEWKECAPNCGWYDLDSSRCAIQTIAFTLKAIDSTLESHL